MAVMKQHRKLFCALVLLSALLTGLACSRADSSPPLGAIGSGEATAGGESESTVEPLVEASGLGVGPSSGLGSFPAFMPPVAVGTDARECKLGTDPYSTCI
jgi:hypothetical protein